MELRERIEHRTNGILRGSAGFSISMALASILAGSASAAVPTNDAEAFKRLDLYLDRTTSQGTSDHINISSYPAFLDSPQLIAIRGPGDTVCVIRSTPYDGMNMAVTNTVPQAFAEYALSTPMYMTSVGLILMNYNVFNGTGDFNDAGKTVARLVVHYVDETTETADIQVGVHTRDWLSGSLFCGDTEPFYTVLPTSPLMGALWPAGAPDRFYDINEFQLPTNKRSVKVDLVRVEAVEQDHLCTLSLHIYSGNRLHGISLWPEFTVMNAQSQPVVRQSQFTGQDHGGYMFGGTPVGTRRTTDVTACQVAAQAMCYTYAGVPASVDGLNAYLQQNQGYMPEQVAAVTFVSPSGDAINYTTTPGGSKLKLGDRFLVEHGTYTDPLATYQVTLAGRNGQAARVDPPHSGTIPSIGDPGRVYWKMKPGVADGFTQDQLRTVDLYGSPQLPSQVEDLLVQNIPVQLNVPGHFVVADGWTSFFLPGGARGTYPIKDPYDPRNYSKLILGKYANKFTMARYVVPAGSAPSAATPGLSILASGARRVEVIDPLGRRILRDAGTGEGVYDVPGSAIEDVSSEHDNGGDVDDPLTGYDVEIPTAVDGTYVLNVYADDGLSISACAYTSSGIFAASTAVDTTVGLIGRTYSIAYSGSGQSMVLTPTGSLGVEPATPRGTAGLRVRQNPSRGPVEFLLGGEDETDGVIDVFDIRGRRVDVVEVRGQTGIWDWRTAGVRPGVYFARLRSRGHETTTRFVVLH
jgi:hypothetical protein